MNKQKQAIEWREALSLMKPHTYKVEVVVKEDMGGNTSKSFPLGAEVLDAADCASLESLFEAAHQWVSGRKVQKCILINLTTGRSAEMKGGNKNPGRVQEEHRAYVLRWSGLFVEIGMSLKGEADKSYESNCRYGVRFFNKHVCLEDHRIVYKTYSRYDYDILSKKNKGTDTTLVKVAEVVLAHAAPVALDRHKAAVLLLEKVSALIPATTETKTITEAVKPARKKAAKA